MTAADATQAAAPIAFSILPFALMGSHIALLINQPNA